MDWKPLILSWLDDARKKAKVQASKPNGSRYKLSALDRAYNSIEQNTETVTDVSGLSKLPRVGDKTVATIASKIKKHCEKNPGIPLPASMIPSVTQEPSNNDKVLVTERDGQLYPFAPPPQPKRREYIPKYGSAPFHVLITMRINELEDPTSHGIGQSELQRLMKPRTSGVLEGAVSRPTPAVGMALKTLKEHECVYQQNSRYFLDEIGRDLANRLIKASGSTISLPPGASLSASAASTISSLSTAVSEDTPYIVDNWEPGTFITRLVIDNREVASKNDRTGLVNDLRNMGVNLDVQALSLGDCVWVAEHKKSGRRAVLDWIIERKTLSDLRSSIHDGRYHDQKKRLSKSTIPHIIYLIEQANNVSNNEMFKDNRKKFMTAMSQTLVKQNFQLKLTRSQNETVHYIAKLTEILTRKHNNSSLKVVVPNVSKFEFSMTIARKELGPDAIAIDYSAYHEALAKSKLRTIGETFRLMLRTIKGISAEKARAVQKAFPTPSHLRKAYEAETSQQRQKELVFRATKHLVRRQQLRIGLSEAIYEVWCPNKENE